MIFFALEAYRRMAQSLAEKAHADLGSFCAQKFQNGEWHVNVNTAVANESCLILGSIAPPDEQLVSLLLLAHTLRQEGASAVTAILPYLAYTRQDKLKSGESLAAAWVGSLFQASAIGKVITVDIHSQRAQSLFPIPVFSLSPARVFAQALNRYGLRGATIVAPDEGAIDRCQAVQKATGLGGGEIVYFEKQRTPAGVIHSRPIGAVGTQVVIIDDILDTGGTLLSACEMLCDLGVEEINIMITHGLFTGTQWQRLRRLRVRRIFSTDSVPLRAGVEGIETLSILPLLEESVCSQANLAK